MLTLWHGSSLENPIFRQGGHEKSIYMGKLPKKGLGQFADLRGSWQKRGGGVF